MESDAITTVQWVSSEEEWCLSFSIMLVAFSPYFNSSVLYLRPLLFISFITAPVLVIRNTLNHSPFTSCTCFHVGFEDIKSPMAAQVQGAELKHRLALLLSLDYCQFTTSKFVPDLEEEL